jgi:hypothetical protein
VPAAAVVAELALVLAGSWAYFRAASQVAREGGVPKSRAASASAMVLVAGLVTLALNVAGY